MVKLKGYMDKSNAEIRIKEAAKKIFLKRGFGAARMQEIADEAGINKAMLHYYFRSKQKLFDVIFEEALVTIIPHLTSIIQKEEAIQEKIKHFIHAYIDMLKENPSVPLFVIHELSSEPEKLVKKIKSKIPLPQLMMFLQQLNTAAEKGEIKAINPMQLLVNMVSMSVFPFLARPIVMTIGQMKEKQFDEFIDLRKDVVVDFVLAAIKL